MRMESANPVKCRKDDRLGRWPFARAVADLIEGASPEGAVVIGIEGPWGAGKSSVLEMAAAELRAMGTHRVARVSAWRTSSQDQFLASLAYAITYSLRRDWSSVWLRLLWARLRRQPLPIWLGILLPVGMAGVFVWVPGAGDIVKQAAESNLKTVLATLGTLAVPLVGWLLANAARPVAGSVDGIFGHEGLVEKSGAMEQFSFEFEVLSEAQAGRGRFVILVEDLDRAAPDRVADVLAAIAQLCGHDRADRLAFLVAYDRDRVLKAVGESVVKGLPEGERPAAARNYIDRVIQVGIPLPDKGRAWGPRPEGGSVVRVPGPLEAALVATVTVVGVTHLLPGIPEVPPLLTGVGIAAFFALIVLFVLKTSLFDVSDRRPDVAWRDAEEVALPLMPENPRDSVRVMNLARAAYVLDADPDRLTQVETTAIAAAVERWPDSFDAENIRRLVEDGGSLSPDAFMNQDMSTAIGKLKQSGVDTRCFSDPARLYRYFLAVRGAKAPAKAPNESDPS